MSSLIKKGLITLLKTVKLVDPNSISEVAEAAEKYIYRSHASRRMPAFCSANATNKQTAQYKSFNLFIS
jgi:hypothetical protein